MSVSLEQFAKSLSLSGLMTADEIRAFHASLPAEKRKDVPHFATELVRGGKLTRYQAATIYQGNSLALVMGDYRILDKIGAGGMGQVFKAEHRRMKRVVALKLLPAEVTKDVQARKRFQREVETAARLIHPNIVTAYDAGEHQGVHYLIMEFVDGHDLANLVKKQGTLPIETAVSFCAQAARGLEHAHAEGVIHRDIKPGNLLVDKKGTVKILDMGLARIDDTLSSRERVEEAEGLTNSNVMMGTVDYMSPEQAIDTHQADHRSDIYSLGCTLFYLLTGRRMFEGETLMKRILAHRDTPPPLLSSLRPDMPGSLEAIFARLVAKLPEERYPTMTAAREALEQCLAKLDSGGDSSVLQFEKVADEDLASFLKSMKAQTGTGVAIQTRVANETLVNQQEGETRPESSSHRSFSRFGRRRSPWPLVVGAGTMCVAAAAVFAALWFNRAPPPDTTPIAAAPTNAEVASTIPKPAVEPEDDSDQNSRSSRTRRPSRFFPEPEPTPEKKRPEKPPEPMPVSTPPEEPPKPAPAAPKQIIVGTGADDVPDLVRAFDRAGPGDTILIRHRGPLLLPPLDMTGKSPLTIIGDAAQGVDFWPLLVQGLPPAKAGSEDANVSTPEFPAVAYGKQVDLTLKKLHLAVGAPPSQIKIGAIFALGSGRIHVQDCSITVGTSGPPTEALSPSLPLALVTSGPQEHVELSLERTYVRGPRLAGCLAAAGTGRIRLNAEQVLWAGDAVPWIVAQELEDRLEVGIKQSTLYNVPTLLRWESKAVTPEGEPAVLVEASQSLFVGPYANKEPLVSWNASDAQADFPKAVAEGRIAWKGSGNVYHRIEGFFREPRGKTFASLTKWRTLWSQTGAGIDRESDPHFRVWPAEYLLQEAHAWDFEPRFGRNREKARQIAEEVGAKSTLLPAALPRVFHRKRATADLAGQPRGVPRVLHVHLKDGPYKTIEEALAEARDGDIAEILDNGPYTPKRNFTLNPGDGVLESKVDCLTIRAGHNVSPVVYLREDVQEGTQSLNWMGSWPVSLAARGRTSLVVDGLHFRMSLPSLAKNRVAIAVQEVDVVRLSNCSFAVPLPHAAQYFVNLPAIQWLENCAFFNTAAAAKSEGEFVQIHSMVGSDQTATLCAIRNCLFNGAALGHIVSTTSAERSLRLSLHNNTFLGRIGNLRETGALTTECWENLAMSSEAVFKFFDDALWRNATKLGERNGLWIGLRALTDQERGDFTNSLLPGPALKAPPQFETPLLAREAMRRFRPKKTTVIAADGANVGVRFDYLPDIPPEN